MTNSYEEDDENRSDERGDHPHREVRCLSEPGARALRRFDPKRETRAFWSAGTNAENDCVQARVGVVRKLEPHADRTRPPGVDHDCRRDQTQPASRRPPFRLRRVGGGDETVGGADAAVIPNAERRQAVALAGAEPVDDPNPADVQRMSLAGSGDVGPHRPVDGGGRDNPTIAAAAAAVATAAVNRLTAIRLSGCTRSSRCAG